MFIYNPRAHNAKLWSKTNQKNVAEFSIYFAANEKNQEVSDQFFEIHQEISNLLRNTWKDSKLWIMILMGVVFKYPGPEVFLSCTGTYRIADENRTPWALMGSCEMSVARERAREENYLNHFFFECWIHQKHASKISKPYMLF